MYILNATWNCNSSSKDWTMEMCCFFESTENIVSLRGCVFGSPALDPSVTSPAVYLCTSMCVCVCHLWPLCYWPWCCTDTELYPSLTHTNRQEDTHHHSPSCDQSLWTEATYNFDGFTHTHTIQSIFFTASLTWFVIFFASLLFVIILTQTHTHIYYL